MLPRLLLVCLAFLPLRGTAALADPGDVIGAATTVVNQVTGEFARDVRTLATGDDVRQEEIIAVGAASIGELMLRDETKVALGPGARLALDRFVYDPDRAAGAIVLNLIKGGFRFITGIAAKPVYVIRTPTASITVRGTIFDAYIEDSGAIWLLLHEGSIRVCNERDECRNLDDPCRVLRVAPGGAPEDPGTWNALPTAREVSFETAFPFVVKPPQVDPRPIFTREDIELGRCPAPTVKPKVRKTKLIEPDDDPPTPKVRIKKKKKHVYVKPRRKKKQREAGPKLPGFSIGIGIGIGGGGGRRGGGGPSNPRSH
jgi:hypothetical protein